MCSSKRKIMTYPFAGLYYNQIKEIGDRVKILPKEDGCEVIYTIPFKDNKFGCRQEKTVSVSDDKIRNTLFYFNFLTCMCRYNCQLPIFKAIDDNFLSYNTYIDSILICVNEIISGCKHYGLCPSYEEILFRFGKQYNPNDLNRLYCHASDYMHLDELFNFLNDDTYYIHASRYNQDGVYFDKINDGFIDSIVIDIVNNKDNIDFFNSSKVDVTGPKLTKKISKSQVI